MLENAKFLSGNEKRALTEIKRRVSALFAIRRFILFGSKARGDASPDSDIDLLLVTERELKQSEKHMISDTIFEVNLYYDTLFSFIAVDDQQWNSRLYSFYPIHINVEREGIPV
ncbi:MAG: nucleotidyltransferase domain-containing protein [Chitinispirillaceae bacterium]|nr:nucleotidyltransferase domain-containing protein [Chitinispirillaceae bacterium]